MADLKKRKMRARPDAEPHRSAGGGPERSDYHQIAA